MSTEVTAIRVFDLGDLVPEPLSVNDPIKAGGDGKQYDVRTSGMLNTEDFAQLRRIYAELQKSMLTPEGGTDETVLLMDQRVNEFMHVLVPHMPPERVQALPFAWKYNFVKWWQAQQPQSEQKNARRASRQTRGTRSPASPPPTTSRRKR